MENKITLRARTSTQKDLTGDITCISCERVAQTVTDTSKVSNQANDNQNKIRWSFNESDIHLCIPNVSVQNIEVAALALNKVLTNIIHDETFNKSKQEIDTTKTPLDNEVLDKAKRNYPREISFSECLSNSSQLSTINNPIQEFKSETLGQSSKKQHTNIHNSSESSMLDTPLQEIGSINAVTGDISEALNSSNRKGHRNSDNIGNQFDIDQRNKSNTSMREMNFEQADKKGQNLITDFEIGNVSNFQFSTPYKSIKSHHIVKRRLKNGYKSCSGDFSFDDDRTSDNTLQTKNTNSHHFTPPSSKLFKTKKSKLESDEIEYSQFSGAVEFSDSSLSRKKKKRKNSNSSSTVDETEVNKIENSSEFPDLVDLSDSSINKKRGNSNSALTEYKTVLNNIESSTELSNTIEFSDSFLSRKKKKRKNSNSSSTVDETVVNTIANSSKSSGLVYLSDSSISRKLQKRENSNSALTVNETVLNKIENPSELSNALEFSDSSLSRKKKKRKSSNSFSIVDETEGNKIVKSSEFSGLVDLSDSSISRTLQKRESSNSALTVNKTVLNQIENSSELSNAVEFTDPSIRRKKKKNKKSNGELSVDTIGHCSELSDSPVKEKKRKALDTVVNDISKKHLNKSSKLIHVPEIIPAETSDNPDINLGIISSSGKEHKKKRRDKNRSLNACVNEILDNLISEINSSTFDASNIQWESKCFDELTVGNVTISPKLTKDKASDPKMQDGPVLETVLKEDSPRKRKEKKKYKLEFDVESEEKQRNDNEVDLSLVNTSNPQNIQEESKHSDELTVKNSLTNEEADNSKIRETNSILKTVIKEDSHRKGKKKKKYELEFDAESEEKQRCDNEINLYLVKASNTQNIQESKHSDELTVENNLTNEGAENSKIRETNNILETVIKEDSPRKRKKKKKYELEFAAESEEKQRNDNEVDLSPVDKSNLQNIQEESKHIDELTVENNLTNGEADNSKILETNNILETVIKEDSPRKRKKKKKYELEFDAGPEEKQINNGGIQEESVENNSIKIDSPKKRKKKKNYELQFNVKSEAITINNSDIELNDEEKFIETDNYSKFSDITMGRKKKKHKKPDRSETANDITNKSKNKAKSDVDKFLSIEVVVENNPIMPTLMNEEASDTRIKKKKKKYEAKTMNDSETELNDEEKYITTVNYSEFLDISLGRKNKKKHKKPDRLETADDTINKSKYKGKSDVGKCLSIEAVVEDNPILPKRTNEEASDTRKKKKNKKYELEFDVKSVAKTINDRDTELNDEDKYIKTGNHSELSDISLGRKNKKKHKKPDRLETADDTINKSKYKGKSDVGKCLSVKAVVENNSILPKLTNEEASDTRKKKKNKKYELEFDIKSVAKTINDRDTELNDEKYIKTDNHSELSDISLGGKKKKHKKLDRSETADDITNKCKNKAKSDMDKCLSIEVVENNPIKLINEEASDSRKRKKKKKCDLEFDVKSEDKTINNDTELNDEEKYIKTINYSEFSDTSTGKKKKYTKRDQSETADDITNKSKNKGKRDVDKCLSLETINDFGLCKENKENYQNYKTKIQKKHKKLSENTNKTSAGISCTAKISHLEASTESRKKNKRSHYGGINEGSLRINDTTDKPDLEVSTESRNKNKRSKHINISENSQRTNKTFSTDKPDLQVSIESPNKNKRRNHVDDPTSEKPKFSNSERLIDSFVSKKRQDESEFHVKEKVKETAENSLEPIDTFATRRNIRSSELELHLKPTEKHTGSTSKDIDESSLRPNKAFTTDKSDLEVTRESKHKSNSRKHAYINKSSLSESFSTDKTDLEVSTESRNKRKRSISVDISESSLRTNKSVNTDKPDLEVSTESPEKNKKQNRVDESTSEKPKSGCERLIDSFISKVWEGESEFHVKNEDREKTGNSLEPIDKSLRKRSRSSELELHPKPTEKNTGFTSKESKEEIEPENYDMDKDKQRDRISTKTNSFITRKSESEGEFNYKEELKAGNSPGPLRNVKTRKADVSEREFNAGREAKQSTADNNNVDNSVIPENMTMSNNEHCASDDDRKTDDVKTPSKYTEKDTSAQSNEYDVYVHIKYENSPKKKKAKSGSEDLEKSNKTADKNLKTLMKGVSVNKKPRWYRGYLLKGEGDDVEDIVAKEEADETGAANVKKFVDDLVANYLDQQHKLVDENINLNDLYISIPWNIPMLHQIETRMSSKPTPAQWEEIYALKVPLRLGPYTKKEDDQIKENFKEFCEQHDIPCNPKPFIQLAYANKRILKKRERQKFVQFLGRGFENRLLYRIYTRFQKIYTVLKKGRFSPEEDNLIVQYLTKCTEPRKVSKLAKILNRDKLAVAKRYITLKGKTVAYQRTKLTIEKDVPYFMENFLKVMSVDDINLLKGKTIPLQDWKRLSEKISIPARYLKLFWEVQISPRIFTKSLDINEAMKKVIKIITKSGITDWRELNWTEIAEQNFDGLTGTALYYYFKQIIPLCVPKEHKADLRKVLKILKSEYEKNKVLLKPMKNISYIDGEVKFL